MVRGLQGPLVGRTFTGVEARWPKSVRPGPDELAARLPGRRVEAVTRRAKYIVLRLSGGLTLLVHLKMTGELLVLGPGEPAPPHAHTRFDLDNGCRLLFRDTRKFGLVILTDRPDERLGRLGPEPLAPAFTARRLQELFRGRRGALKPTLLDQSFLAGLGNIYADESCFRAGLSPRRPVQGLQPGEIARLHRAIRAVLRLGIMTREGNREAHYRGSAFHDRFAVYGRTGLPCPRCGTPVERAVLDGRSTHHCPRCQR